MARACLCDRATNICVAVLTFDDGIDPEDYEAAYDLDEDGNEFIPPDTTGEVGDVWNGVRFQKPTEAIIALEGFVDRIGGDMALPPDGRVLLDVRGIEAVFSKLIVNENVLHNGQFQIFQRGAGAYGNGFAHDRCRIEYSHGGGFLAPVQCSAVQQYIAGQEPELGGRFLSRQSDTKFLLRQTIENRDCLFLRGGAVTLSVRINPVLVSGAGPKDFIVALVRTTGSPDAPPSTIVNNWASTNYSPGNFFSASVAIEMLQIVSAGPSANAWNQFAFTTTLSDVAIGNLIAVLIPVGTVATNAGIDVSWKLERGPVATRNVLDHAREIMRCRRLLQSWRCDWSGVAVGAGYIYKDSYSFAPEMRATPSITVTSQTNSGRYPLANGAVLAVDGRKISYRYTAAYAGGNDGWTASGLASAEI